ncbi:hypothetical protein Pme01_35670 [Planosporangium mesophilum]|uniref:Uncharacterized protein n=1 Tax=Planosporangium mesophilum TaxID=689768 RepID=A0A8J3TMD4_9ACTN|nr:hypothetical protein Pme01_35670 [Planosporangium mesophilum]
MLSASGEVMLGASGEVMLGASGISYLADRPWITAKSRDAVDKITGSVWSGRDATTG